FVLGPVVPSDRLIPQPGKEGPAIGMKEIALGKTSDTGIAGHATPGIELPDVDGLVSPRRGGDIPREQSAVGRETRLDLEIGIGDPARNGMARAGEQIVNRATSAPEIAGEETTVRTERQTTGLLAWVFEPCTYLPPVHIPEED